MFSPFIFGGNIPIFWKHPNILKVFPNVGMCFFSVFLRDIYTLQNAPPKKKSLPSKIHPPKKITPFSVESRLRRCCQLEILQDHYGRFGSNVRRVQLVGCWMGWIGWVLDGFGGAQKYGFFQLGYRVHGGGKGKKEWCFLFFFQEPWGLGLVRNLKSFWDVSIFIFSSLFERWVNDSPFNSEATNPTLWKISSNTHQVQSLLWLIFDSTEQCLEGVWLVWILHGPIIPTTVRNQIIIAQKNGNLYIKQPVNNQKVPPLVFSRVFGGDPTGVTPGVGFSKKGGKKNIVPTSCKKNGGDGNVVFLIHSVWPWQVLPESQNGQRWKII